MVEKMKVHLIGIGGSGMSPIAKVLLEQGWEVSGSDLHYTATIKNLQALGAVIHTGHNAANLNSPDLVITSTAIGPDNPELLTAKAQGVQILHRSEMLAMLLNQKKGIAVAGAHGKTTITSMIAVIMERSGLDPTVLIGGELSELGGSARSGQSPYLVAEADESDGSFLRYKPYAAVVSNIEADHLENFNGDFTKIVENFAQFLENIKPEGLAVLGTDDPLVRKIQERCRVPVVSYGLEKADYTASSVEMSNGITRFELVVKGESRGLIELRVPGRHNISNALAAIAVADHLGVDFAAISKALKEFHGANRRFQFVGNVNDILIVDDYAHHPTEIKATIRAAKEGWNRRVIAVFQPHRYTRTQFLFKEFTQSFGLADETIIANIYSPAPDKPIPGITAAGLAQAIAEESGRRVRQFDDHDEIIQYLAGKLRPGDMVITMGAGDIWLVAQQLAEALRTGLGNAVG